MTKAERPALVQTYSMGPLPLARHWAGSKRLLTALVDLGRELFFASFLYSPNKLRLVANVMIEIHAETIPRAWEQSEPVIAIAAGAGIGGRKCWVADRIIDISRIGDSELERDGLNSCQVTRDNGNGKIANGNVLDSFMR